MFQPGPPYEFVTPEGVATLTDDPVAMAVLTLRFGWDGHKRGPRALSEVGEMLGLDRNEVRQAENRGLQALQAARV